MINYGNWGNVSINSGPALFYINMKDLISHIFTLFSIRFSVRFRFSFQGAYLVVIVRFIALVWPQPTRTG